MLKSILTWAILAVSVIDAAPTDINSNAIASERRDFDLEEARTIFGDELDARHIGVERRDLDARATRTLSGLANFEKLDTSIAPLKQIGNYGGLYWQGLAPVSVGRGNVLSGIVATSPPNVAIYGTLSTVATSKPIITAKYSGSTVSSFSLDSFYFGCLGSAVLRSKCTVAVAGYNSANKLIAYQSFLYTPVIFSLKSDMQLATLNKAFKGLSYVRLASTYTGVNAFGTTAFDNVKYTLTTT